ncbi:TPA: ABC transporter permease [candidate division WWE3 bacterium]|nr:hypothetical protein P147_WWE3C00001G0548 [candidate division WWE3 bacterium RAAC2_WWE3_1]KKS28734.1 MAG: hypothetical protein UU91_C0015G0005 [candidate division WWE3 bacterium GW2011_GWB1_42_117]KKS54336.1 MAG: hypothetical protein UV21_C0010G0004 [candidate division WWE3 bacterium GW2011_GWD2_42_34]KKT05027.1 MAG: hypothetical protein UV83_C0007G0022 [candidate division WWE3 bacterium GW2011_GWE2_43_18]KKT06340.1 MAG: hypothetical protein UV84_C0009G0023 [candidate division WWE3 bacterium
MKINKIFEFIKNIPNFFRKIPYFLLKLWEGLRFYAVFMFMFTLYVLNIPTVFLIRSHRTPNMIRFTIMRFNVAIARIAQKYDTQFASRMSWFDLFDLAFRNMAFKKTRSIITVGGMALGIAAIVFLVSLGYGVQNLVITRVAKLDEMKQVDVSTQPGSRNKITDKSLEDFKSQDYVEAALPLVGVAAKVKFEGSVTDVAVYGVTTKYLENSAIKPIDGVLFKTEDTVSINTHSIEEKGVESEENIGGAPEYVVGGDVSGVMAVKTQSYIGDRIGDIEYTIFPNSWLRVYSEPKLSSKVIGYTKRMVGVQYGEEYWGQEYVPAEYGRIAQSGSGEWMGKWIKAMVPVWEQKNCPLHEPLCEEGRYYPTFDESGGQMYAIGYTPELEIMVNKVVSNFLVSEEGVLGIEDVRTVLGDSAPGDSAVLNTTGQSSPVNASGLEQLSDEDYIAKVYESSASAGLSQNTKVVLPDAAQREAVVNTAFLKVLGFHEPNSVGSKFNVSFVLTGNLLDSNKKVESEFTEYKIVGIIPGDDSPFFYVPLNDLRYLGVTNFSQVKIIATAAEKLAEVRKRVESGGFLTSSVVDTVAQINQLFSTIRLILGLLGGVALGVASLGMFNTLTVSLLERTREVGLMKAMGMTTDEVKRLFLTESILMGFMGGVIGMFLGFICGKFISLILSIMGLIKGAGFIDITYIPPVFLLLIFFLSLTVGLVTGIYPSRRATKISALDALRYE